MRNLFALTRRELGSLFLLPSLHLVTAFFVLLYGAFFAMVVVLQEQSASFDSLALFVLLVSIFIVPLITMRSFAEERASGTLELLLTAPVNPGEVILSKFIGAMAFYLATLAPLIVHILLLEYCGRLDWGATFASVLGLGLLGATFVSLGLFVSCLTASQIVAAAAGIAANIILLLLDILRQDGEGLWRALGYLSFVGHFKDSFATGQIDTRALVYFLTMPIGMLFLTWLVISSRGLAGKGGKARNRRRALALGACTLGAVLSLLAFITWIDVFGSGLGQITGYVGTILSRPLIRHSIEFLLLVGGGWVAWRFRRERNRDLQSALIGGAAGLLILININYIANYPLGTFRDAAWPLNAIATLQPRTWDLSETKYNTLSVDTQKTLDELGDRVDITVFYSSIVDYNGVQLLKKTRELLTRYSNHSSLIRVRYVDAETDRAEALTLAEKMQLNPRYMNQAATVQYRDRRTLVPAGMATRPPNEIETMANKKAYSFQGELAFSTAIKRILDPRTTRVYFSTGHGEYRIGSTGREARNVGRFAEALGRETFEVHPLFLKGDPIPSDCDVLLMPGPELPLGGAVLLSIKAYLEHGGRLLVLLPSITQPVGRGAKPALVDDEFYRFLNSLGGEPRGDSVFDHKHHYRGQSINVAAGASNLSPISKSGRAVGCMLPNPQSIRDNPGVEKEHWMMQRLLLSSEAAQSHTITDKGRKLRKGPFSLGFSAARKFSNTTQETRVVVIGNTEFLSNLSLDQAHNRALGISTVHWLAGRDYQIRVPEAEYIDRTLQLDPSDQRLVAWISLVWLPLAWVVLALGVWWMRKQ